MAELHISEGRYYRTRDGQKVGPMIDRNPTPWDRTKWRDVGGRCWHENGEHYKEMQTPNLDIIAEWTEPMDLTAITTPFGLLDAETQAALKAHGGPYERFASMGNWVDWPEPDWVPSTVYRVKPQPPKPREWWITRNIVHDSEAEAASFLEHCIKEYGGLHEGTPIIHVREVLP